MRPISNRMKEKAIVHVSHSRFFSASFSSLLRSPPGVRLSTKPQLQTASFHRHLPIRSNSHSVQIGINGSYRYPTMAVRANRPFLASVRQPRQQLQVQELPCIPRGNHRGRQHPHPRRTHHRKGVTRVGAIGEHLSLNVFGPTPAESYRCA